MVRFLRGRGSSSTLRPRSLLRLVPGPRPGTVGRGLPGGQGGHAPLPERPGLSGFVEARGPPEVGAPGAAPLGQRPSAARVPQGRLADHGLAGADRAAGGTDREVQPGGGPGRRLLLHKRGFEPELVGRGLLGAL